MKIGSLFLGRRFWQKGFGKEGALCFFHTVSFLDKGDCHVERFCMWASC